MAYSYRITDRYDNEWFGRVPFYWRSAQFWQTVLSYGETVPWTVGSLFVYTGLITGFSVSIQNSLWFIVPLCVVVAILIAQIVVTTIIAQSPQVDYDRRKDLNLNNYYKLPKKIRKQLRPAAKHINKLKTSWETRNQLTDWSKLVDGYLMLHPYTESVPEVSKVLEDESKKLNELLEVNKAERARIEHQKKIEAEIEKEVQERVKAQLKLEGKEYIELNV